jgi:hypothetical protein
MDNNQIQLDELKELVEKLKTQTLQYKLFTEFFPSIPEDDIYNYILIVPEGFRGELPDDIGMYPWLKFSNEVTEFVAYDSRLPIAEIQ